MTAWLEEYLTDPDNACAQAQETLMAGWTEALTRAMAEQGIRRTDLARRAKVSRPYITQVLGGKYNMNLRTVAKLAHTLGYRVRLTLEAHDPD